MSSTAEILKVRLTAEGIQDILAAMKRVQHEVKGVQQAGDGAEKSLGNLGTLFAAQQMAKFVNHAIAAAESLWDMSQKTGAAVEGLSVLVHMGGQAGVASEDLEKGLIKLSKSMDGLQKGDGGLVDYFHRIGLSAEEMKGLKPDEALLKIANAQGKFADGSGKAAVMLGIFGKSGASLIPLLNDMASGGFEKNRTELEKLGLVMSTDMAKSADDFKDSMDRMEKAAQGATVQIAQTFLPGLTKGITALAAALAGTPAGVKAFTGSFVAIGTVATAATIAVRTLYTAIAGLGPIGLAVVALSAVVSVVLALKTANEAAQAEAVKESQDQLERIRRGEKLLEQYKAEAKLLEKGGLDAKNRKEHEEKLKVLKEEIIKLGPEYAKTLADEAKGHKEVAEEIEKKIKKEREDLDNKNKALKAELARLESEYNAEAAYAKKLKTERDSQSFASRGMQSGGTATPGDMNLGGMTLQYKKNRIDSLKAILVAGGALEGPSTGGSPASVKPEIITKDTSAIKAAAAAKAAEVKRAVDAEKQILELSNKDYEDLYAHGLISLEDYYASRVSAIKRGTALEAEVLEAQVKEVRSSLASGATEAEKIQASTRIKDLEAQIRAKRVQGDEALRDLDRKNRDERAAAAVEALKLEAELAQAKGETGAAGIRAIEEEYARRIQLARTPEAKAALSGLRDAATGRARLGDQERRLDSSTRELNLQLEAVNTDRAQGLIGEEEALRRKLDIYRETIPVLEQAAKVQAELAAQTGNPEDLLRAKENSAAVEALKGTLKGLEDQFHWIKSTARDAFQQGIEDLLVSLSDRTTSLIDKFKALGRAIANALLQQAAAKTAALITDNLFGVKKAGGGYIAGPGTSTSDSIPAWLSNGEYVIRAASVQKYGLGMFNALNGLSVPRSGGTHFAQGGLVGPGPSGLQMVQNVTVSLVVNAATGQTGMQASGGMQADRLGAQLREAVVPIVIEVLRNELRPRGVLREAIRG